ncbi:MAG: tetratricopeptide repeat protein, partial [Bacteroidota bacterium]
MSSVLFTFLFLVTFNLSAQKQDEVQLDLRAKADGFFEADDFESAAPLYSQLLSLSPKDTLLSFQFGACLSMSPAKSRSAIAYIEPAVLSRKPPKGAYYFYGRSLMADGRFKEAADAFREFKSQDGTKVQRESAEALLKNCEHAIELSSSKTNLPIVSEREIPRRNFFSSFTFTPKEGKVVPAAEQFLSKSEREKFVDPVMFISGDQQTIYLAKSARGSSDQTDLYIVIRQSNGQWSEAVPLVAAVNSSSSEDYAFLDPSGRTLYFSSKGFNSIGGYDVFRSDYDFSSGGWSAPVNMGLGINTIGDDMLFVTSSDGTTASFVTTDRAEIGKAFFRTVELPKSNDQLVQVKGFYRSADQQMRRDARISIVRQNDRALVATTNTDDRTGQYALSVPSSGDYYLVVEGGGYVPHIERFSIPAGVDMADIKQSVTMDRSGNDEKMQVKNYFRSTTAADLASEEPAETITRTYASSDVDSSSMVSIRIGDVTLLLPEPPASTSTENSDLAPALQTADSSPDAKQPSASPQATAQENSAIDKELPEGLSESDSSPESAMDATAALQENGIEQQEQVDSVSGEPDIFAQPDISDEDLARLAMEDAKDNRDEAAELRQEAASIRTQAEERRSLAESLLEGVDMNDSASMKKNAAIIDQADDLNDVASLAESRAAQLD